MHGSAWRCSREDRPAHVTRTGRKGRPDRSPQPVTAATAGCARNKPGSLTRPPVVKGLRPGPCAGMPARRALRPPAPAGGLSWCNKGLPERGHPLLEVSGRQPPSDRRSLAPVLTSMPGIGVRTAARILLEVGDASVFPTATHIGRLRRPGPGLAPVTRPLGIT